MIRTSALFLTLAISAFAADEPAKSPAPKPDATAVPVEAPKTATKKASVLIAGKKIPYKATAGKIQLKGDDGKVRASIFHVSYEWEDVSDRTNRPVMFAFNGGPG